MLTLLAASAATAGAAVAAAAASASAAGSQAQRPAAAASASIEIDASAVEGRISPLLYGQFMEFMFEGVKRGLHAELLRNRSFEEPPNAIGLSREWERYPDDRDDDYGIAFSQDDSTAYPPSVPNAANATLPRADGTIGGHSLRIELRPAVIERHGVYQARVPVRAGVEYHGYVWMRTSAFTGDLAASLEADMAGGRVYAEARVTGIARDADWKQYAFTLTPTTSDRLARFAILFITSNTANTANASRASGKVWLDQVSLMPGDAAAGGVRADVFERVKALAPAFIRWPGGNVAQDYHWRWGIGARDERPMWINLSWKNELEPSDFGTDEFIQFARAAGAEPTLTVNVEGRGATSDEAAAWVKYCADRVKYWEIGNEIWGDWVRGHSDAATYARNLTRYVAAMRAVNPSIKIIAVGDNDMHWNRTVLQQSGERFDYLAIHHYYSQREMRGDLRKLMERPLFYQREYEQIDALFREFPADRRPKLAINEWGLDLPESQQYSILAALYGARLMNVFERRSDLIAMTAVSDLLNGWPGGIIQASRHGTFITPIYLVNQLYATHLGAERLATRVESQNQMVDAVASRSADGRALFIKIVNTDVEHPQTATVTIRGARVSPTATADRVVADSLTAANSFATPDAVHITHEPITAAADTFSLELPRHSVAVVTLTVAAP